MSGTVLNPRSGGVALVVVLWIVAALSTLALGLIAGSRSEIRSASVARDALRLQAYGDAAIQLALRELAAKPLLQSRLMEFEYEFEGERLGVRVVPSGGLLNVNRAAPELLAAGIAALAGLEPEHARALAGAIVLWRSHAPNAEDGPRTAYRNEPYAVIEDLLQVPGMDYEIFARIRRFVTLDAVGDGRVVPLAAPDELLLVLARGDAATAARVSMLRERGEPLIDVTVLEPTFSGSNAGRLLHLEARMHGSNAFPWARTAQAYLTPDPTGSRVSRIVRTGMRSLHE